MDITKREYKNGINTTIEHNGKAISLNISTDGFVASVMTDEQEVATIYQHPDTETMRDIGERAKRYLGI